MLQEGNDLRLPPKERKHPGLWQSYLWWKDLQELRKKHLLRLSSINRGKSNMNAEEEELRIENLMLDHHIESRKVGSYFRSMVDEGEKVGPIWGWMLSQRGIAENLAAQILAQFDDISKFDTISKFWRYSGYGIHEYWVDENEKRQCPKAGWKLVEVKKGERYRIWTVVSNEEYPQDESKRYAIPQNLDNPLLERIDYLKPKENWKLKKLSDKKIKSYHAPYNTDLQPILWTMTECFVRSQSVGYIDIFYAEKERLRNKHPEKVKENGHFNYTDGHINNMAKRFMRKAFLKDLWLTWRTFEGLPVTEEYTS